MLLTVKQLLIIIHMKIPIKFLTDSIESSLCDYSDAHILATGDAVVENDYNADLAAAT